MPACVPLDGTVCDDYDGIALAAGDVDDKYDGKQLDRLWRWTGLITAAKMGVRYCSEYYIVQNIARTDHSAQTGDVLLILPMLFTI